jgi:hypothetical protein
MPVQTQIQQRRGTAASWTSTNPTLAAGEIGFESDTNRFKIGNGSTAWASLSYWVQDPVTTKGDLYTFSTTDARLAVGANGETLVADSSTSTGLRYQSNFSAGKNAVINGAFNVWQRGTSFSFTAGGASNFCADRFFEYQDGTGTVTASQQTFTPGTAPVSGYEGQYFQRLAVAATGTSTLLQLGSRIEDVRTFAGQTVTFSFWAKADSARSSIVVFLQSFGSGGSGAVVVGTPSITYSTSWQRFSYTFAMPSVSGKTIGAGSYLEFDIRTAFSSGSVLDVWGVQWEASNTATAFQTATGTIQGELAACQRYFNRFSSTDNAYNNFSTGNVRQTGAGAASYFGFNYPVEMRIAPTAVTTANITSCRIQQGGTDSTVTSAAFDGATTKNGILRALATITTAGSGTLAANNATNVTIDWSAEL